MPLKILGLNHNTAPVEIREQVAFSKEDANRVLGEVIALDGIDEVVVVSTCNRTEFYVDANDDGIAALTGWLATSQNLSTETLQSLFVLEVDGAVKHLFGVACGLNSMVLGEPQILGQLKDFFRIAETAGTTGRTLGHLFRHSFSAAKKVRTDTEIGASPVSVAYAAVNLANQFYAGFENHTALLIGAGSTIRLVAQHLQSRKVGRLFVANRDVNRARELASEFGGFALPLSELEGTLPEADILISSTASPEPILTLQQMKNAIRIRKRKPIFAVDIAVPRDLDPDIGSLEDVYLYSIDDLDKVIGDNRNSRENAAGEAHRILAEETRRYLEIERGKQLAPIISTLRDEAEAMRLEVLAQARRRLRAGADEADILEYATAAMMKKLLHGPSVQLRKAGENKDQTLIDAARILFELGEKDDKAE